MAYARRGAVGKAGMELWEGRNARALPSRLAVGRLRAISIVKGFADAIVEFSNSLR